ncbi:MAG: hypothetical protein ACRYG8_33530 [Janthinobacterium lividum]
MTALLHRNGRVLRDGVIVIKTNPYAIGIRKSDTALKAALDEWIGVNLANGKLNDIRKRYNGVALPEEIPA